MRLFLSSENLGNYEDEFLSLLDGVRLAYIGNAKDDLADDEREAKVLEHKEQFESLGLSFTEIDLRMFFEEKAPEDLLHEFDGVWCAGGNTFLLRAAMQKSNFDTVLTDAVKQGIVVYGGSSAGAVIAGPTLEGTEHGDDPSAVRQMYEDEVIWEGLGLIPYVVIPHYGSEWFGSEAEAMEHALIALNVTTRKLSDGQVIVVSGDREEHLQ